MIDLKITPAATQDRAAVEALVEAAYHHYVARIGRPPGPMLDDYAAHIAANALWLAHDEKGLAGLVVLLEGDGHLLLDNVAVHPTRQGEGIGKRLMAFAEFVAIDRDLPEIRLYTHVAMTENQAIYQRLGYSETHRIREKGLDRVYMAKRLN
ncbi:GNAT family N-acetyltransferase [Pararhizobium haloflavum]|uniref:GNAT family N-acetyltransferase n=1 Tax=Pararhizobium haloflavum TaxID=2037914 RepID=UPI000C196367|nr:GNAT family N-acetyltransferase [Pararhizobium haloflavum]